MGLNFQKDLKSQNHILDTFMHSIKKLFQFASWSVNQKPES